MACGCQGMVVAGVTHRLGVPRGFSPRGCSPSAELHVFVLPGAGLQPLLFSFFFFPFSFQTNFTEALVYENILPKELTPTWQIETIGQLLVLPNLTGSLQFSKKKKKNRTIQKSWLLNSQ